MNLTRNDFEFNGEFFLQIKGTAMGKKFAPAYANIFMAKWETTALASCSNKTVYYYRFLDDLGRVTLLERGFWWIFGHSKQSQPIRQNQIQPQSFFCGLSGNNHI